MTNLHDSVVMREIEHQSEPRAKERDVTYNPGQARVLFKHIDFEPKWFLLGGPADADEAQTVVLKYPDIKVLACEPSEAMRDWQLANGFPLHRGLLLPYALADDVGIRTIKLVPGKERCSTMVRDKPGLAETKVQVTKLDTLSLIHGPFEDAILWLDIEGMELPALRGAEKLFAAGKIKLVNLEYMTHERPDDAKGIDDFMARHGLKMVETWNNQGNWHDRVYKLENK